MRTHRGKIGLAVVAASVAVAAVAVAKGGGNGGSSRFEALHTARLAWVHPSALPKGWSTERLPHSAARLASPAGWSRGRTDPGTRTVLFRGPSGRIAGYLNATPRQGEETLANWSSFRVEHNEEEEELDVTLEAAAAGLRFRTGHGSCVIDSYRTTSGNRFREIACIVAGPAVTTVVVGAAPPALWDREAPTLERAIDSFTT
jgi:hypothetical protein